MSVVLKSNSNMLIALSSLFSLQTILIPNGLTCICPDDISLLIKQADDNFVQSNIKLIISSENFPSWTSFLDLGKKMQKEGRVWASCDVNAMYQY